MHDATGERIIYSVISFLIFYSWILCVRKIEHWNLVP